MQEKRLILLKQCIISFDIGIRSFHAVALLWHKEAKDYPIVEMLHLYGTDEKKFAMVFYLWIFIISLQYRCYVPCPNRNVEERNHLFFKQYFPNEWKRAHQNIEVVD
jgi:hypothetical protein